MCVCVCVCVCREVSLCVCLCVRHAMKRQTDEAKLIRKLTFFIRFLV